MCTFHLTMERADAVRGLARSVRPALERFELVDPVPEPWLHLTMNGLGFADEVPDDRLEAVADEVFALWSSLDDPVLRFTHLFVGLEGAMLVAERSDWLMALARAQRAAVDRLLGPREWGDFWPHASLCYFNGPMDPRPLVRGARAGARRRPGRGRRRPRVDAHAPGPRRARLHVGGAPAGLTRPAGAAGRPDAAPPRPSSSQPRRSPQIMISGSGRHTTASATRLARRWRASMATNSHRKALMTCHRI